MRGWKDALTAAAAAAFGAALLVYALRDVEGEKVLAALAAVRLGWLPVLALFPLADLAVRALRWRLLLEPVARAGAWKLFELEAVGLGLNNLIFFRVGELARAYLAGRELEVPVLSVLANILVERLLDSAALLALFGLSALAMPELIPPRLAHLALAGLAAIVLGLAGVAWVDGFLKGSKVWRGRLARFPRLARLVDELVLGTCALRAPRAALAICALSFALWLVDGGIYWATARAMAAPPLSYPQSLTVVTAAAAGSALPAVPGAWGNVEAAIKEALTRFGYPADLAVALATLAHLVMYVVVTTTGILSLYGLGHTFSSLRAALDHVRGKSS